MAVSWYNPTIRRFADPSKHARLYQTLAPLFTPGLRGELDTKSNAKILAAAQEWGSNKRITSGITQYQRYHRELLDCLPDLRGQRVIFIPGTTIDQATVNPKYLCVDYASERNVLTERILRVVQNLQRAYGWDLHDDVNFISVAPVVLPFRATKEGTLVHSLDDAIDAVERDGKTFGNRVRDPGHPDFLPGIYQYSASIVNAEKSKEIYGKTLRGWLLKLKQGRELSQTKIDDMQRIFGGKSLTALHPRDVDKHVREDTDFNRALYAAAFATVVKELELKQLDCYLAKSSPEFRVMESVSEITGVPMAEWNMMRNAKMSSMKEADPAALRLLEGKLYYFFAQGKKVEKKEALQPIRVAEPRFEKPEICDRLTCMQCPHQGPRCACDFAEGNFRESDIAEVLKAKGSNEDVRKLHSIFRQLYTPVTYIDEHGKIQRKKGVDILLEDNEEQGWTFGDITSDLKKLQHVDAFIAKIGSRGEYATRSWQKFLSGHAVEPLPVPESRPSEYSIRPSEFSNPCVIGRILSKVDVPKLESLIGEKIIPHKWGLAGTMRHLLALWRPWTNYAGRQEPPVWEYTEREVWTSFANTEQEGTELDTIKVFGHLDAAFQVRALCLQLIFDYKRSPNEKQSYTTQELLYLRSVQRALGIQGPGALVLVNRPHFATARERKQPLFRITYADDETDALVPFKETNFTNGKHFWIEGLETLIVQSYKTQHQLMEKESFLSARKLCCSNVCNGKGANGECQHPFNSQMCNAVNGLVEKGVPVSSLLSEGVKL